LLPQARCLACARHDVQNNLILSHHPMTALEENQRDTSAERFLRLVQAKRRGTLKVYLGLAAGVGKTFRMLQEAHDLHQHGVDVLLGYVETHGRAGTVAELKNVPLLPRKQIFYKG